MGLASLGGSLLLLLLLTLLSSYPTAGQLPCPRSARANGTRTAGVGTRVVLDCGLEGAEWQFNGRRLSPSRWQALNATAVVLNSTQLKDTGSYACLRNGTVELNFRLVIEEVPRMPAPSCIVKSYLSPIRCEWSSPELGRWTKCLLSSRMSYQEKPSLKTCKFYTGKKVCVCMLAHKEGAHERYHIRLAVYNGVGCTVGAEKTFNFENL
ncbi:interleukin-6 receptor subunit alpha-like, partial [Mustelus asterias]